MTTTLTKPAPNPPPAPTGAPGSGAPPIGLPYLPGIDGLRAIAVLAVVAYHAELSWATGGFLGVEVFFVISGYLITSILLSERRVAGKLDLKRFWIRRARRLLPALFLLIAAAVGYTLVFLPDEAASLRGDAAASLGYITNWYLIFGDQSYFETVGRPSLLQHLWSLAIEEQFYVVWPLLFAGGVALLGRKRFPVLVAAGVIASAALMWGLYDPGVDPSRLYYGTDTRAAGLFVGVLLAFFWAPGRLRPVARRSGRWVIDIVGVGALLFLLHRLGTTGEYDSALYRGGFLVIALLTAAVIGMAAHPSSVVGRRVLGAGVLVWIGVRSYGIYLWHWPVVMLTRPGQDIDLDGPALLVLRLGLTLGLATLSFHYVERPIRRGELGRRIKGLRASGRVTRKQLATGWAVGAAVLALAFVVMAAGLIRAVDPAEPSELAFGEGPIIITSADLRAGASVLSGDADSASMARLPGIVQRGASRELATGVEAVALRNLAGALKGQVPPPSRDADNQALVRLGSVAERTPRPEPPKAATPPPPPLEVDAELVSAVGDSVLLGGAPRLIGVIPAEVRVDGAVGRQFSDGVPLFQELIEKDLLGDAVVIHLGNNGILSDTQVDEVLTLLADVPRVVIVNVRVPRDWQGPVNERLAAGVTRHPNAVLADWYGLSEGHPEWFAADRYHLSDQGMDAYANLVAASL